MATLTDYLICDISTAPLPDVASYIDTPRPRKGTKDADKQQAQIGAKISAEIDGAGLDPDLCQITGIGSNMDGASMIVKCATGGVTERDLLAEVLQDIRPNTVLIGFNALKFDWPVLIRRCQYLGLPVPQINLDRYRTPHIDLFDRLSHHGAISAHSLGFYARRLGWTDLVKPLSGADESSVLETQDWAGLEASLRHDVTATARLARWMGIIA